MPHSRRTWTRLRTAATTAAGEVGWALRGGAHDSFLYRRRGSTGPLVGIAVMMNQIRRAGEVPSRQAQKTTVSSVVFLTMVASSCRLLVLTSSPSRPGSVEKRPLRSYYAPIIKQRYMDSNRAVLSSCSPARKRNYPTGMRRRAPLKH